MWQPLLTGAEAAAARAHVDVIARRLEAIAIDPASAALFWAYYSSLTGQPTHEALLAQSLERCLERLGQRPFPLWLHGGSLGAAWAVTHVLDDATQIAELLADYDAFLLNQLAQPTPFNGVAGTISGVAGALIYAIERQLAGDQRFAQDLATAAARCLLQAAQRTAQGWCWPVPQATLDPDDQRLFPQGATFCGPGHGMSGIVSALAKAHSMGLIHDTTMIEQGTRWLSAQDDLSPHLAQYPHTVGPGAPPVFPPMLGWCSGVLATTLQRLAGLTLLGRPTGDLHARLRAGAATLPAATTVNEMHLCHGFVGHALLFHYASVTTGNVTFDEAARRWYREAHRTISPGAGEAAAHRLTIAHERDMPSNFLQGSAGIALGLLALGSDEAPPWLRLLGFFETELIP